MTNPTPKFSKGDRVEIPHRNVEGEVVDRWQIDGEWVYRIKIERDGISMACYQEKSLEQ